MTAFASAGCLAALVLAAACAEPSGPPSGTVDRVPATAADRAPAGTISVYSQNLYVGANVDEVIAAFGVSQEAALAALGQAVATLHRTSFPARAAAINSPQRPGHA